MRVITLPAYATAGHALLVGLTCYIGNVPLSHCPWYPVSAIAGIEHCCLQQKR